MGEDEARADATGAEMKGQGREEQWAGQTSTLACEAG